MSSRVAELAIRLTADAADAISGADSTSSAYDAMGKSVDKASKAAESGSSRIEKAAGASDNLASKSSQATGGLGALASGLELVGLGPYAAGLQSASMATDFFSGVGDIANLVLESQAVASARAKVAMIGQAVASRTAAVAQRVLNLAMAANPVLLVVAGVTLLIGLFVLLYKKSDLFRKIVNGAMSVAKAGVDKVKDAFSALGPAVTKVFAIIGRIASTYVRVYVGAFKLVLAAGKAAFQAIRDIAENVIGWLNDHAGTFKDKFVNGFNTIRRVGINAFNAVTQPVQDLIDLVGNLIDKISHIHIPGGGLVGKLIGGSGGSSAGRTFAGSTGSDAAGNTYVMNFDITLTGTASPSDAEAFMTTIDRTLRSKGKPPVFS